MKQGDKIQIEGNYGFYTDPIMEITVVDGDNIRMRKHNAETGGILSHDEIDTSISFLESRHKLNIIN